MRKLFTIACFVMTSAFLIGQSDDAKLRDAMKQIGPTNGSLGKKLAAKDPTSADDAGKLQALFESVQKFWEERKTEDAVGFAKAAAMQFGTVSQLAKAGQWDDAVAAQKKVGANCMGCHTAHREKAPDGSWTIK